MYTLPLSTLALALVAPVTFATAQTVINIQQTFTIDQQEDLKGGYIAAIVILSIVAVALTAALVLIGISNRAYYASKALDSDDEGDEDDAEMHNVLEGGAGEEEEDEGELVEDDEEAAEQ